MNPSHRAGTWRRELPSAAPVFLFLALLTLCLAGGCKKSSEVDDPQLKPIQEMLNQSLPVGSSEAMVTQFLAVRGYPQEAAKRGTVVAIIRHIDTEKLQPVTARVTFYFDANGKLNDTEIVRTFNQPIPQPQ
jgi:hypothetical protein